MASRDKNDSFRDSENPYLSETNLRVLDVKERRPIGNEIQCITEPSLFLVRLRVNDIDEITVGSLISIPSENLGPISEIRLKDISGSANQELIGAISEAIISNPDTHLGFFNRASPMNLKFHSFQLLPGIGNSKALQMVDERGLSGWESFEQVDESCGIESVRLLAERYVKEMEDIAQTPRLLDLIVRTEI